MPRRVLRLEFLRQLLRVPGPGTRLAGACFIVSLRFRIPQINKLDAVKQRSIHRIGGFIREV